MCTFIISSFKSLAFSFFHIAHSRIFDVFIVTIGDAPFGGGDAVTRRLLASGVAGHVHWNTAAHPAASPAMRARVAGLRLDVLVHGEIGMDIASYFIAFTRLARRSVVFWGHAVTSGIVDDSYEASATGSSVRVAKSDAHRAGPDYFVSSVLFEDARAGGRACAQMKYSERLVLMQVL
jgi:hypothetical protein